MNTTQRTVALLSTSALAAGAAHGAILYIPVNITISQHGGLNLDLNQDGTTDFTLAFNSSAAAKPYISAQSSGLSSTYVLSASSNQGLPVTPSGTTIDGTYESLQAIGYFNQDNGGNVLGSWNSAGNVEGYVGLELQDGSGTHFGWAHFIYNTTNTPPNSVDTGTLTLVDAAMETASDVGIQTGQTAAPGTPAVVVPPSPQTGYPGGTVQFMVAAAGNPAPSFQWRAGAVGSGIYTNVPLGKRASASTINSDGTMNVLSLRNLRLADAADVVVVVSNSSGSVTSSIPARLTVLPTTDAPATLVHRYSFQDPAGSPTFADSVGGPDWNGTLQGDAVLTGSSLSLDGTNGCYAALPSGITSNYTQMSVEFWADVAADNMFWTRVFSFGDQSGTLQKANGLDYCPYAGSDYQNVDLSDLSGADCYANNNAGIQGKGLKHVTIVVDSPHNSMYYYNGASLISTLNKAVPSLTNITDTYNLIGASLVAIDPYLEGTIYEFRVYQGALPAKAVALNDAAGPANYIQLSANPAITVIPGGPNLTLAWPASDFGFAVQAKSGVTSATTWSTLTNPPALVGTNWQVSLPSTGAAQFFQLIAQ